MAGSAVAAVNCIKTKTYSDKTVGWVRSIIRPLARPDPIPPVLVGSFGAPHRDPLDCLPSGQDWVCFLDPEGSPSPIQSAIRAGLASFCSTVALPYWQDWVRFVGFEPGRGDYIPGRSA